MLNIRAPDFATQSQVVPANIKAFCKVCVCVCVCVCASVHVSACAQLCLTLTQWTVACQVPMSMEFSRQEYWSWLLFSSPGYLCDPGIKPTSLESLVLAGVILYQHTKR